MKLNILNPQVDVSPRLHNTSTAAGARTPATKDWVHLLPVPNALNGALVGVSGPACTSEERDTPRFASLMREYLRDAERRVAEGLKRRGVAGARALILEPTFCIPGVYLTTPEYIQVI